MPEIVFSCDVEDPRPDHRLQKRYVLITEQLLELLAEANIHGSFFFVGEVAETEPALVRKVAAAGHEVAFHSMHHEVLPRQRPALFKAQCQRGKQLLEDITGVEVVGYRAPVFSLTRQSLWAVDILTELGYRYSSSVLPAGNPLYGLPGAPLTPFRWHSGLVEFPAPLAGVAGLKLPFLGGFYLRYLPAFMVRRWLRCAPEDSCLWAYCHPYDFDSGQSFYTMKNTALWVSLLLWMNRANTFNTLKRLLTATPGVSIGRPFAEQLAAGRFSGVPQLAADYFMATASRSDNHS